MALCKVIKSGNGWNLGDEIEVEGERLAQLVADKVVVSLEPEVVEPEVKKAKKK